MKKIFYLILSLGILTFSIYSAYYFIYYLPKNTNQNTNEIKKEVKNTIQEKNNNEFNTLTSNESEKNIRNYFNFIDSDMFDEAYSLLGETMKDRNPYIKWKNGYTDTLNHNIDAIFCTEKQCTLNITATENTLSDIRKTNYSLRYDLIKKNNKVIITNGTFISQELKEVIETKKPNLESVGNEILSVVKIYCLNLQTGELGQGTGTIINSEGIVLSNSHVKGGNDVVCQVNILDNDGLTLLDGYFMLNTLFEDSNLDYWLFSLDNNTNLNSLKLPTCNENDLKIGDNIRILGYPGASGGNITITEGLISSFSNDGNYYVTSAKIDSGNSGGLAVDLNNNCFLGIPTAVYEGNMENYGLILKSNIIYKTNNKYWE